MSNDSELYRRLEAQQRSIMDEFGPLRSFNSCVFFEILKPEIVDVHDYQQWLHDQEKLWMMKF